MIARYRRKIMIQPGDLVFIRMNGNMELLLLGIVLENESSFWRNVLISSGKIIRRDIWDIYELQPE